MINTNYPILLAFIFGIILTYTLIEIKQHCFIADSAKQVKAKAIQTLVRQGFRWTAASYQDENPIIALLHANYGVGYISGVGQIASDREVEQAIHQTHSFKQLESIASQAQERATKKIARLCPQLLPKDKQLLNLMKAGGEA